jgi:hypothetical protein
MPSKAQKIQKMLDGASLIKIDGIELTGWTMDSLKGANKDDIIFEGYAETEDGDYHWSIPAWGLGEIASVKKNEIYCKDDTGEECNIECFKCEPFCG